MLQAATGAAAALTPAEQTWQTIAADLESGAAEAECPQVRLGFGFGFGLGLGLANPNPSPSPSANPSPNPKPSPSPYPNLKNLTLTRLRVVGAPGMFALGDCAHVVGSPYPATAQVRSLVITPTYPY